MSCYAIGIGGSGARCVEALVHLCAAGLGPKELRILFVDADGGNGNLKRSGEVVESYIRIRTALDDVARDEPPFRTSVRVLQKEQWNPLAAAGGARDLATLFQMEKLERSQPGLAGLLKMLFTDAQMGAALRNGFLGRPSIGAAAFGETVDPVGSEPWKTIKDQCTGARGMGAQAKIFFFGSIFGGTGAAGMPTLPLLLQEKGLQDVLYGGALMLPYFEFPDPQGEEDLYAHPSRFLANTRAALRYYAEHATGRYDRLYVLGDPTPPRLSYSQAGGAEQTNPAHIVELLAALAALDFFNWVPARRRLRARPDRRADRRGDHRAAGRLALRDRSPRPDEDRVQGESP